MILISMHLKISIGVIHQLMDQTASVFALAPLGRQSDNMR